CLGILLLLLYAHLAALHSFPTRRSSDLAPRSRPRTSVQGQVSSWPLCAPAESPKCRESITSNAATRTSSPICAASVSTSSAWRSPTRSASNRRAQGRGLPRDSALESIAGSWFESPRMFGENPHSFKPAL